MCQTLLCPRPLSREQRPRLGRLKLAQREPTSHVIRTPLSRSKGQGHQAFTQRGLNAWGRCSGDRETVLGVGNYCYVASSSAARQALGRPRREEIGGGNTVSPRALLVNIVSGCFKLSQKTYRTFLGQMIIYLAQTPLKGNVNGDERYMHGIWKFDFFIKIAIYLNLANSMR